MSQNVKKNYFEQKKNCVGWSVGLLVYAITFEGIELLTLNLVHKWVSIKERFGLLLSEFCSEGG